MPSLFASASASGFCSSAQHRVTTACVCVPSGWVICTTSSLKVVQDFGDGFAGAGADVSSVAP